MVSENPTALSQVDIETNATNLSVQYFSYLHTHPIVACYTWSKCRFRVVENWPGSPLGELPRGNANI